jgi:GNAT superfamily N-acetyltransferase
MGWRWVEETPAHWDGVKSRILGAAPAGVFNFSAFADGDLVPGLWWRVEDDDRRVVGYGWMDYAWGDGEILLAVDPDRQHEGAGTFILEHLQTEAAHRGIRYLYNVIPEAHPDPDGLERWLAGRGFKRQGEGRLLRAPTVKPGSGWMRH